jgi:hypothetical protein
LIGQRQTVDTIGFFVFGKINVPFHDLVNIIAIDPVLSELTTTISGVRNSGQHSNAP